MKAHVPHLLIVDDEPDTCANLMDIFSDIGYEVTVACDGPTALRLAAQKAFDVALLDLRMPDMDGLDLFKQLKRVAQGTAAIIITAYASTDTARDALEAGASGVMSKPVDMPALFRIVEDALEQPLVLVVDDDVELCESLRTVLLQRKYRVCVAHDIAEAQEYLHRQAFHIVLFDLALSTASVTELLRSIRVESPDARTILIDGQRVEGAQSLEQAMASGVNAICYRPFDTGGLLNMIGSLSSPAAR